MNITRVKTKQGKEVAQEMLVAESALRHTHIFA